MNDDRWFVQVYTRWVWVTARDAARHAIVGKAVVLGLPRDTEEYMVKADKITERAPHVAAGQMSDRPHCRMCHRPCPPRRSTFCSTVCVHEYATFNRWGMIRALVSQRDRGVCSECGIDTRKAKHLWRAMRGHEMSVDPRVAGWPGLGRDWWEADHIVARKDGGRDRLENLRTLCVPCHKARTAKQRRRWAAAHRDKSCKLFANKTGDIQ